MTTGKRLHSWRSLTAALLFALVGAAAAAAPAARVVQPPLLDVAPRLDGRLDDEVWSRAALIADFTQREPHKGEPATLPTEVRLFYTSSGLYVGVRLADPDPRRIVASVYRRDEDLAADDFVELFLDTFGDSRNAFYFATNAVGAQRDGLIRDEGEALNWEWDGLWSVASARDEHGWSTEMAIPFSTLRFGGDLSHGWGLNVGRYVARLREDSYWAPIDPAWGLNAKWRVSAYGRLEGIEGIRQGGRLQLKPFAVGGTEIDHETGSGRAETPVQAGLDAKLAVTPALTGDLTFHTDFAQVEADQNQVNLSRFPLFYPEKRDFFLENVGLFQFGERVRNSFFNESPTTLLFFSRRIGLTDSGRVVPIAGGARLTGKVGGLEIGALDIVTRETTVSGEGVVPRTNFAAARLQQGIFGRSSLGAIFLNKKVADSSGSNSVVGADANLVFKNNVTLGGFVADSSTPLRTGAHHAMAFDAGWSSDRASVYGKYADIGEDFNAEMGFLERVGIRKYQGSAYVAHRLHGRGGIRQLMFGDEHTTVTDRTNRLQSQYNQLWYGTEFESAGVLVVTWLNTAENLLEPFEIRTGVRIPAALYRVDQVAVDYSSNPSRVFSGATSVVRGGFFDGTLSSLSLKGRLQKGRISSEVEYSLNRISLPVDNGRFSTHLLIGRASLAFSPRAFVNALTQFDWDARRSRVSLTFRYSYRRGSDLYLVYDEERGLGGAQPGLRRRQFLAKFTYYLAPL